MCSQVASVAARSQLALSGPRLFPICVCTIYCVHVHRRSLFIITVYKRYRRPGDPVGRSPLRRFLVISSLRDRAAPFLFICHHVCTPTRAFETINHGTRKLSFNALAITNFLAHVPLRARAHAHISIRLRFPSKSLSKPIRTMNANPENNVSRDGSASGHAKAGIVTDGVDLMTESTRERRSASGNKSREVFHFFIIYLYKRADVHGFWRASWSSQ